HRGPGGGAGQARAHRQPGHDVGGAARDRARRRRRGHVAALRAHRRTRHQHRSSMTPSPTVGILYPGYSAEDDYPLAEQLLDGPRLPLVHTEMRVDAHRVDALLDIGGDDVLAAGLRDLPRPLDAVVWACTSGS